MKRRFIGIFVFCCLFVILSVARLTSVTESGNEIFIDDDRGMETLTTSQLVNKSGFIIDQSDPLLNWSVYETNYSWCVGSGTWEDPYVIANITIDGNKNGTGIVIQNSHNVYFVLRNVTVFDAYMIDKGGIVLYNTHNGTITNCTSTNNANGIFLDMNCVNNTIYNNTFITDFDGQTPAYDNGSDNHWNHTGIGNYYSDYGQKGGVDANDDGVGDTPYNVSGTAGSLDHFPIWEKDTENPMVTLHNPITNQLFGTDAPNFYLTVEDTSIRSKWYRLYDGTNTTKNYTVQDHPIRSWMGTINEAMWDSMDNGTINIQFYVNDSAGNVGSDSVSVRKDSLPPILSVSGLNESATHGNETLTFNITVSDGNLDKVWYEIEGEDGTHRIFLDSFINGTMTGEINETIWSSLPNGNHTIEFFANDTLGNQKRIDFTLEKYIEPPKEETVEDKIDDVILWMVYSIVYVVAGIVAVVAFVFLLLRREHLDSSDDMADDIRF